MLVEQRHRLSPTAATLFASCTAHEFEPFTVERAPSKWTCAGWNARSTRTTLSATAKTTSRRAVRAASVSPFRATCGSRRGVPGPLTTGVAHRQPLPLSRLRGTVSLGGPFWELERSSFEGRQPECGSLAEAFLQGQGVVAGAGCVRGGVGVVEEVGDDVLSACAAVEQRHERAVDGLGDLDEVADR